MSVAQEDPRLTAYALGQLSPEETHEFEAELQRDARAHGELAAIRVTSFLLERELGGTAASGATAPALSERRRAKLRAAFAARGGAEPKPNAARASVKRRREVRVWLTA